MNTKIITLLEFLQGKFFDPSEVNKKCYKYDIDTCEGFFDAIEEQYAVKNKTKYLFMIGTAELKRIKMHMIIDNYEYFVNLTLFLYAFRDSSAEYKELIQESFLKDISYQIKYSDDRCFIEEELNIFKKIDLEINLSKEDKKTTIYKHYKYFMNRFKNCTITDEAVFNEVIRINIAHKMICFKDYDYATHNQFGRHAIEDNNSLAS